MDQPSRSILTNINGTENVLRAALKRTDFTQIEQLAHATSSSAASVGFSALLTHARALEKSARSNKSDAIGKQIALCERSYELADLRARRQLAMTA